MQRNLDKAKYEVNPLEDGSLAKWQVLHFNISALTMEAVKPFGLGQQRSACVARICGRWGWRSGCSTATGSRLSTWLNAKFAKNQVLADANIAALNAGHAYGETAEIGYGLGYR